MKIDENLQSIKSAIYKFNTFHKNTIPLCAAENIISPFAKIPLSGNYQERYIMGGTANFNINDNFIGSQYLVPFYELIEKKCKELFNAKYVDAKTLSGMNCVLTLLMSITNHGDKIFLLDENSGGHPSVPEICKKLGLDITFIPFNYEKYTIDYDQLNLLLIKEKPKYICLAPSDIIFPFEIERLELDNTILLYDASQLLGLIAGGVALNPLNINKNIILFGGTHKTLPGPTHGLIMTNSKALFNIMATSISPKFIRNTQMNQVLSLLFTLTEFSEFGHSYTNSIVNNVNELGGFLEEESFNIAKDKHIYSKTHQLFIKCSSKNEMDTIYRNAILSGVTLNKKERKLFGGYGIRIGVQEITRYGWKSDDLKVISFILNLLRESNFNKDLFDELLKKLPPKKIKFTYPKEVMDYLTS